MYSFFADFNKSSFQKKGFLGKYRSLYNSVETGDDELNSLHDVININITE